MKKTQHIVSSESGIHYKYDAEYDRRIARDNKRVVWINVIGFFSLITFGIYTWEIKEFGNNFATFILRHGNFFGPILLAFVCYLIIKKVRQWKYILNSIGASELLLHTIPQVSAPLYLCLLVTLNSIGINRRNINSNHERAPGLPSHPYLRGLNLLLRGDYLLHC